MLLGNQTNQSFLVDLLCTEEFSTGSFDTSFVESLNINKEKPGALFWLCAALLLSQPQQQGWKSQGGNHWSVTLACGQDKKALQLCQLSQDSFEVQLDKASHRLNILSADDDVLFLSIDGLAQHISFVWEEEKLHLGLRSQSFVFSEPSLLAGASQEEESTMLRTPMTGRVVSVHAAVGDKLSKDQRVLTIEAMKMEHTVCAQVECVLTELSASLGQQVRPGQLLGQISTGEES
jgi:geranyl-CoA carboxylase alpha subunit